MKTDEIRSLLGALYGDVRFLIMETEELVNVIKEIKVSDERLDSDELLALYNWLQEHK